MKNYKQILEAVNRGIKFALSDLEDNEELSSIGSQKQGQIDDKNYTRELLDLKKEVVDLGLPSRTLWCKYNLGVNPNQLSNVEDWCGDYYSWGELEANKTNKNGKIYFEWNNYKFGKDYNKLTKYCTNSKNGLNDFTDNLTELLPEDDAAYQNKKLYKFYIPTKEQFEELLKYTNNYWVKNYNPNKTIHNQKNDGGIQGLNGRVFIGKNGNQLFIPATGYCDGLNINHVGSDCNLWSSSLNLNNPCNAYFLGFDSDNIWVCGYYRYIGYNICPVINL